MSTKREHEIEAEPWHKQFSSKDIFWIVVGVIVLILLAYIAIEYDIVSTQEYLPIKEKYNATLPSQVPNQNARVMAVSSVVESIDIVENSKSLKLFINRDIEGIGVLHNA